MIPFTKKLAYVYIIKKIELNFCYIKKNFMYIYIKRVNFHPGRYM